jgi:hypothetical protein
MTNKITFLEFEEAVRAMFLKMDTGKDARSDYILIKAMLAKLQSERVGERLRDKIGRNLKRNDGVLEG